MTWQQRRLYWAVVGGVWFFLIVLGLAIIVCLPQSWVIFAQIPIQSLIIVLGTLFAVPVANDVFAHLGISRVGSLEETLRSPKIGISCLPPVVVRCSSRSLKIAAGFVLCVMLFMIMFFTAVSLGMGRVRAEGTEAVGIACGICALIALLLWWWGKRPGPFVVELEDASVRTMPSLTTAEDYSGVTRWADIETCGVHLTRNALGDIANATVRFFDKHETELKVVTLPHGAYNNEEFLNYLHQRFAVREIKDMQQSEPTMERTAQR